MPDPGSPGSSLVRFGVFELDLEAGELRRNGRRLRIEGQPLQVLAFLLERPGRLVTREELQQRLWSSETFVDFEHGINSAIKRLRKALDDSAQTPRFIETLPRRGYRFIYPLDARTVERAQSQPPVDAGREESGDGWPVSNVPDEDGHLPAANGNPVEGDESPPVPVGRTAVFALLGLAAVAAVLVALKLGPAPNQQGSRAGNRPVKRLAVLPLQNLTDDADQQWLVDEIHSDLTAEMTKLDGLVVLARNSVLKYRNPKKALPAIASELRADYLLAGDVRREGEHWDVALRLNLGREDRQLWSHSYALGLREMSTLPGQVVRAVSTPLHLRPAPGHEAALARARPLDPALYTAFSRGQYLLDRWTPDNVRQAVAFLREALAIDPMYAPAWSRLGEAYLFLGGSTEGRAGEEGSAVDPRHLALAEDALKRAIELDPTLVLPHRILGRLRFTQWDWEGGKREYERAYELDPTHAGFAVYLLTIGRFEDAVKAQKREAERDFSYPVQLVVGWTAFMAGRFDEAIEALKVARDVDPNIPHAHRELAWCYVKKGMRHEAFEECGTALALMRRKQPAAFVAPGCEWVYALTGRRDEALALAARIESTSADSHRFIRLAHVFDALGERDRALDYLRKAYEAKAAGLPRQWYAPMLSDDIKADPRFQDLIRRTGNPWATLPPARLLSDVRDTSRGGANR